MGSRATRLLGSGLGGFGLTLFGAGLLGGEGLPLQGQIGGGQDIGQAIAQQQHVFAQPILGLLEIFHLLGQIRASGLQRLELIAQHLGFRRRFGFAGQGLLQPLEPSDEIVDPGLAGLNLFDLFLQIPGQAGHRLVQLSQPLIEWRGIDFRQTGDRLLDATQLAADLRFVGIDQVIAQDRGADRQQQGEEDEQGRGQATTPQLAVELIPLGIQGASDLDTGPAAVVIDIGDPADQCDLGVPQLAGQGLQGKVDGRLALFRARRRDV